MKTLKDVPEIDTIQGESRFTLRRLWSFLFAGLGDSALLCAAKSSESADAATEPAKPRKTRFAADMLQVREYQVVLGLVTEGLKGSMEPWTRRSPLPLACRRLQRRHRAGPRRTASSSSTGPRA